MKCPFCQNVETRVVDSRPVEENAALRRRRQCERCGERFTTYERVAAAPLMVVKRDGRREEFSRDKLRHGLLTACSKRPVATLAIDEAVTRIEAALRLEGVSEVEAQRVGEAVMTELLTLDQVAFVRFASVYQQFDDVKLFAQLLERLSDRRRERFQGPSTSGDEATLPGEVCPGPQAPRASGPDSARPADPQ